MKCNIGSVIIGSVAIWNVTEPIKVHCTGLELPNKYNLVGVW